MKNSKYIKVSVSDRLPESNTDVIILGDMEDVSKGYVSEHKNWWQYGSDTVDNIEYWLEEKPDYEDEMKEMLAKCMLEFGRFKAEFGQASKLELEIKSLLTN
ncbi:DUF551 domain-containing protein [Chryseobacterium sp. X308]|uniref:DUF551 domain-containing protein n=1 Tax=Chryseobacterium sp. X308 TaxID=2884873 RepID=UPI001D153426|nr:DUF551 domain-containing protein [Chryseobacterium sp. X308]MCC3214979.1 DUF551 domain-containing protein [Chryseobacterium sp. X308]